MALKELLEEDREIILGKWFEVILETYPRAAAELLGKQRDRFRNPVGHAISESIRPIYEQVVGNMDRDGLLRALDTVIRIRSVQDFGPAEALGFIFELKRVLRDVVSGRLGRSDCWQELAPIESRIDEVALLGFEKYTECREQLHQVRANELKRRAMARLERRAVAREPAQNDGAIHEKP